MSRTRMSPVWCINVLLLCTKARKRETAVDGGPLVYMCSYDQNGYLPLTTSSSFGLAPSMLTSPMPVLLCVPENAADEIGPFVWLTFCTTVPVASSIWVVLLRSVLPMSVFTKTARVPELGGRLITVIARSFPPTSFQLVVFPAKMSWICFDVRPVTPVAGFTIT